MASSVYREHVGWYRHADGNHGDTVTW